MNRNLPSTGLPPAVNNDRRASKKALDRTMKGWMKVRTPGGRRRKKYITKVEGGRLRELVVSVANELHARRRDTSA
jgi:hypothetical protein